MCRGGCANLIKGASFLMQILPAGVLFNFVEKQEMYLESIAGESFEEQIKRREKKLWFRENGGDDRSAA